jgi:hypothetical protein
MHKMNHACTAAHKDRDMKNHRKMSSTTNSAHKNTITNQNCKIGEMVHKLMCIYTHFFEKGTFHPSPPQCLNYIIHMTLWYHVSFQLERGNPYLSLKLNFISFKAAHVARCCNSAAHVLAAYGSSQNEVRLLCPKYVPDDVNVTVSNESAEPC